jgi:hypothetical protein
VTAPWDGHIITATTGIPEMVGNTEVMLKLNLVRIWSIQLSSFSGSFWTLFVGS